MRHAAIAAAAFLALGFDCDDESGLRRQVEAARERWAEEGYTDYALTLRHDCFCGSETRGPTIIQKRFGEIQARFYVEGGGPVPADLARFFPDMNGLFDFIEEAIERDAASIRAEFHPELGYPTQVFVDYHENTADEERGYRVLALEPLRAGE
jgi:hypothetical protein